MSLNSDTSNNINDSYNNASTNKPKQNKRQLYASSFSCDETKKIDTTSHKKTKLTDDSDDNNDNKAADDSMPRVVHLKRKNGIVTQDCDIYIGRECFMGGWKLKRSIWYNPYSIKVYGSRENVLKMYKQYILNKPELLNQLCKLSGMQLGCWCAPNPCHGDILCELYKKFVISI